MPAYQLGEVDVREHVAVHHDRAVVEQVERVAHGTAGAERRVLHGVADLDAERAAVAEHGLDPLGPIGDRKDHVAHAGARQQVELVAQERPVDDRHDGLGEAERQGAEPRALTAREDDRSHDGGQGS